MKKILLLFTLLVSGVEISQTFDGIPTGAGFYINKIIASPPTVYKTPGGDLTLEPTGNSIVTQELTLEYYEFRGPAGEPCPANLYFVGIEGDGEYSGGAAKTDMGKVDEAISLAGYSFGSNGLIAIVSNYTDTDAGEPGLANPYTASIAAGTTVITIELSGPDVTLTNSTGVTSKTPDIGYDGNIEDYSVTYMLMTSGTVGSPVNPKGHDLDTNNDGVIDGVDGTDDEHLTDWVLYDSISYLDNDDQLDDNSGNDTGEYGYGQIIFARDLNDKPTSYKTTTSALVIDQGSSNLAFIARQGYKTGHTINDWMVGANTKGTNVPPAWKFTSSGDKVHPNWTGSQAFVTDITYGAINPVQANAWNGATADWGTDTNWDIGIVPATGGEITIDGTGLAPIIGSTTGVNIQKLTLTGETVTIEAGGSLIVNGTSSGNITHKRTVTKDTDPTKAWFSVSSPVSGATVATLQTENNFAPGTAGGRIGLATYKNDGTKWNYYTTSSSDAITPGTGLTAKLNNATAGTDLSFTGTYTSGNIEASISQSTNNFNFVGNPYTAYVNLGTFFTDNNAANRLSEQTIWIWDENKNGANMGGYVQKMSGTDATFEIAPGQGFFVSAGTAASNKVTFTDTNQSHQTESFLRSSNSRTEINLSVAQDDVQKKAKLYYIAGTSKGFDNGFDGSMFTGIGSNLAVYTELVSNNQGKKLGTQSLPNSDYENMIVPIGVKATANKEITFSAEALNLPQGIKVFIEDRENNVFTNLNEGDYKVTLTDALDGIGRFYLYTTESALSIDNNVTLNNISIFKTTSSTLRIVGLQQGKANVKLFNVLGKQVLNSSFETKSVKDLSLPKLAKGIYIVQLTSENGKLNKKIILE